MKPPPLVLPPTKKPSSPALTAATLLDRPAGARAGLAGARVLIVEDDQDCRELIRTFLERAGATVRCVDSVAAAMDCVYRSFDPDVVLTDYSMPVANGLELIRQFRRAPSSRAIAVPILVISGHSEENWRARSLAAGAADLLTKPFDPAVLVTRIAAAVAPGRSGPH
ncbi:MAG TPA: response regulator [Vicinamibacteria bacterium]|nr:response regulator [Vicinamibacteria bacterium]